MKQYEADQQRKLFQWTTFIRAKYPEIDLMFHIPNGGSYFSGRPSSGQSILKLI